MKDNLNAKSDTYDPECSLVDNLQRILGIDFPGPADSADLLEEGGGAEASGECGICYNFHLVRKQSNNFDKLYQVVHIRFTAFFLLSN